MTAATGTRYALRRDGIVMRADPDDPAERLGVLNPASARDHDGTLYLFPRIVGELRPSCEGSSIRNPARVNNPAR